MPPNMSNGEGSASNASSSENEENASGGGGESPTADLDRQIRKYRECLNLLYSRLHLLNYMAKGFKGADVQDEGKDVVMLSGAVHALQQASLTSFLAARTVHQLIDEPPERTDTALRTQSYTRLEERLGLLLRGNVELARRRAELTRQRLEQQQEQHLAAEERDVFLRTLTDTHASRSNPQHSKKAKQQLAQISRKAIRTNFIRVLIVMLVKSSGARLLSERGRFLIAVMRRFCRPVSLREL